MQTSPVRGNRRRASVRTRRLVAGLALGLALPVLASCGFKTQTNEVYQPAVGTNARDSRVDVLGAVIVSPETGSGAVVATLVNNDQATGDTLESVTGTGDTTVTLAKPVEIPAQGAVNLADTGGIPVTGKAVDSTKSNFVSLTFTFTHADPVTISMPVVIDNGPYAGLGTPEAPPSAPNSVAAAGSQGATATPTS
ncbi:MAG: hypothetical protein JWO46_463 [Nocardioidaceae bacterium]|nr:hypothetical protein [Nocardioidaceae bacterium]